MEKLIDLIKTNRKTSKNTSNNLVNEQEIISGFVIKNLL